MLSIFWHDVSRVKWCVNLYFMFTLCSLQMSKTSFYGSVNAKGDRFEAELPGFLTSMYDRESMLLLNCILHVTE